MPRPVHARRAQPRSFDFLSSPRSRGLRSLRGSCFARAGPASVFEAASGAVGTGTARGACSARDSALPLRWPTSMGLALPPPKARACLLARGPWEKCVPVSYRPLDAPRCRHARARPWAALARGRPDSTFPRTSLRGRVPIATYRAPVAVRPVPILPAASTRLAAGCPNGAGDRRAIETTLQERRAVRGGELRCTTGDVCSPVAGATACVCPMRSYSAITCAPSRSSSAAISTDSNSAMAVVREP